MAKRKTRAKRATKKKSRSSRTTRRAPKRAAPSRNSSASANLVGKVLFLAGVILALLAGLVPNLDAFPWVMWVLVILGALVGVINISPTEQTPFLVAGSSLLLVSVGVVAFLTGLGNIVPQIFTNIIAFVAPTVLIVAIIAILNLARD